MHDSRSSYETEPQNKSFVVQVEVVLNFNCDEIELGLGSALALARLP